MIHTMKLDKIPFIKILNRTKKIESRIYDEKRKKVQIWDEIVFSQNDNPNITLKVVVIWLLNYRSFNDLFEDQINLFWWDTKEFLLKEVYHYLSKDDENKYWVLWIRIKIID